MSHETWHQRARAIIQLLHAELISGSGELKASDDLFDASAGGHSVGA